MPKVINHVLHMLNAHVCVVVMWVLLFRGVGMCMCVQAPSEAIGSGSPRIRWYPVWVLETKLGSSIRAVCVPNL